MNVNCEGIQAKCCFFHFGTKIDNPCGWELDKFNFDSPFSSSDENTFENGIPTMILVLITLEQKLSYLMGNPSWPTDTWRILSAPKFVNPYPLHIIHLRLVNTLSLELLPWIVLTRMSSQLFSAHIWYMNNSPVTPLNWYRKAIPNDQGFKWRLSDERCQVSGKMCQVPSVRCQVKGGR